MKYLIFGANGQLGSKFIERLTIDNIDYIALNHNDCDITDINSVQKVIKSFKPDFILNCAAYNLVDEAEKSSEIAYKVNQKATQNIAISAKEENAFLVHFSTDYVFDGNKGKLYSEKDITNPINEYGKSKLLGENAIKNILDKYLIFRLSWVYGNGKQNFIYKFNEWLSKNNVLNITEDEYSIPSSTNLIVNAVQKALQKNIFGLYHLVANSYCSRYEWANEIVKIRKMDIKLNPVSIKTFNLPAQRPYNSAMSNELLSNLIGPIPTWQEDLKDFLLKN